MILKQTIQRGRRERRSRRVLLLVRGAAEAIENKAGRLFQYHAGKKKRPLILVGIEDVIVREMSCVRCGDSVVSERGPEDSTRLTRVSNVRPQPSPIERDQYFLNIAGGICQRIWRTAAQSSITT